MVWAGGTKSQHVYPCPSQPYWVEPMSFPFKDSEGPQEQAEKTHDVRIKTTVLYFFFSRRSSRLAAFYAGFLLLKCSLLEYSIVAESPALLRSGDRAGGGGVGRAGLHFLAAQSSGRPRSTGDRFDLRLFSPGLSSYQRRKARLRSASN